MNSYTILRLCDPSPGEIPRFSQEGFFFNEWPHLQMQRPGPLHLITALNQQSRQADARCAFFVGNKQSVSPQAAPFGSVEFTESLPESVLDELLDNVEDEVKLLGSNALRLTNYPDCYAPEQARRLTQKLLARGFKLISNELNFYLPVDNNAFERKLHTSERRRLNKCRRAGFHFEHWTEPLITQVIAFLLESRRRQGYPLTIPTERLQNLMLQFPEYFPVFVIKDGTTIASMVVAIRVRHDILYSFLPADNQNYRTFSPMVMLTEGLYQYSQSEGITLLDLGVSLDHNRRPKNSLMRFKYNLGAQASPKLVFEKKL